MSAAGSRLVALIALGQSVVAVALTGWGRGGVDAVADEYRPVPRFDVEPLDHVARLREHAQRQLRIQFDALHGLVASAPQVGGAGVDDPWTSPVA
jgi:hypothetical protein